MKLSILSVKDLRSKKPAELDTYVTKLTEQKAELIHQISLQKENKTHQLGQIQRAIAQAKTIKHQQGKEQ